MTMEFLFRKSKLVYFNESINLVDCTTINSTYQALPTCQTLF